MRQKSELRSYQRRVRDHLYESPEAFAVLKMGAGKTISALTAIEELIAAKEIRHALIVAPKRVATIVWPDEIESWAHTRSMKYSVLDGTPTMRMSALRGAKERQLTIIGIDNVQWLIHEIENWPADHPLWDCLVIDETSKLKDPKSKRAKALATVAGKFKNRWGLTGTPTPNSLLDLFNPARVITNGGLWGKSFYQWRKQHFYPTDFNQYNWAVLPGHDEQIRAEAASISITLGEGDMPDLPELSILVDEVTLPPQARAAYRQMEIKLLAKVDEQSILAMSQAVATGKLAQMANGFVYDEDGAEGAHVIHGEKQAWIEALVDDLEGEPLIVVYEYKEDLAMLRRVFGDIPYLGAGVPDQLAQQHVKDWNAGKLPIFALHPASGGHGLNLQSGGSRMAWLSPTWSAELWDQTCARLIGQASPRMS